MSSEKKNESILQSLFNITFSRESAKRSCEGRGGTKINLIIPQKMWLRKINAIFIAASLNVHIQELNVNDQDGWHEEATT